jgi:polygalacturonase
MKAAFLLFVYFVMSLHARGGDLSTRAENYPASLFGIKSDGATLNTRSIQYAIDYISAKGGGNLLFSVGQYLTGSIYLKSKVTLQLDEGAILLGSLNPFDYDRVNYTALIFADGQQDISITGKGIIEGRGRQVVANITSLVHSGIIQDPLVNDRPGEGNRPMLIYFRRCANVSMKGITLRNSASWVQTYDQCKAVNFDSIRVDSRAYWNNDGFDIVDCDGVNITAAVVDAADDGICLKSQDAEKVCSNVVIRDCSIRSSANAIKFGTASFGGFSHIRILNNKVFDTYRSAIALEAVDGGSIDDIVVDSLQAWNTGNALFLRAGRRGGSRISRIRRVQISHLQVDIAAGKPDSGYAYEGPVEDQPRNISPIVISGLPGEEIGNIVLRDIVLRYPGGGNAGYAYRSLVTSDSVPELPAKYPEFSMFKELPAWGMYIRHVRDLQVSNLLLSCVKKDYRMAVVMDDVKMAVFTDTEIKNSSQKGKVYQNNCEDVRVIFGGRR